MGGWGGGWNHVQQIKKAAAGMSPSPPGASSSRPSPRADPAVSGESPVCIPRAHRAPGSTPVGQLIIQVKHGVPACLTPI